MDSGVGAVMVRMFPNILGNHLAGQERGGRAVVSNFPRVVCEFYFVLRKDGLVLLPPSAQMFSLKVYN